MIGSVKAVTPWLLPGIQNVSLAVNTTGSPVFSVVNSPGILPPRPNPSGGHDSVLYSHRSLDYLVLFSPANFLYMNFGQLPSVFITVESQLLGGEYNGKTIMNSKNSMNIRRTSKSLIGIFNGTRKDRDTFTLKMQRIVCSKIKIAEIPTL